MLVEEDDLKETGKKGGDGSVVGKEGSEGGEGGRGGGGGWGGGRVFRTHFMLCLFSNVNNIFKSEISLPVTKRIFRSGFH